MGPSETRTQPLQLIQEAELAAWREVRTAAICDELKHTGGALPRHIGVLDAGFRNLTPGAHFAGQALTVRTGPGAGAGQATLDSAWRGAVIMVDARAHPHTTVWGGNMIMSAATREVAAVVVDGLVRDIVEVRASGVAVWCRNILPAGNAYGATFNVTIECGGVEVHPGDLVVGDDDGVVVVSTQLLPGLLARCQARMAADRSTQARAAEEKQARRAEGTAGSHPAGRPS